MSDTRSPPINWTVSTLGDVIACIESGSRPRGGVSGINSGVPSLGGEHLGVLGGFRFDKMRFVPEDFASRQTKGWIKPGDILVVKDGATTGRVSFVGADFPYTRALLNEHVFRCAVAHSIDATFIFYWLYSAEGKRRILLDFRGAAQGGISRGFVSKVSVPVAPLPEQHRIVEAIESYLTRVDDTVANLERVKAKLKAYRASVLKAAVEGRLVPTEASLAHAEKRAFEPAEALLAHVLKERRRRWEATELATLKTNGKVPKGDRWKVNYQEPVALNTSKLPLLPEGWAYTRIESMIDTREGMKTGPFGTLLKKHEHVKRGVPVLGIENIEPMRFVRGSKIHLTNEKAQQLAAYSAEADDLLISRSGTVGDVCVVPHDIGEARCSTNVMRVRFLVKGPLPAFFSALLNGSPFVRDQIRDLCKGTTRDFLNQRILSSLVFPLPPLDEQTRILAAIDERISVADAQANVCNTSEIRSARLRQSILKWAFEGKLVDQNPSDEPAVELLARIRAERATVGPINKTHRRRARGAA